MKKTRDKWNNEAVNDQFGNKASFNERSQWEVNEMNMMRSQK